LSLRGPSYALFTFFHTDLHVVASDAWLQPIHCYNVKAMASDVSPLLLGLLKRDHWSCLTLLWHFTTTVSLSAFSNRRFDNLRLLVTKWEQVNREGRGQSEYFLSRSSVVTCLFQQLLISLFLRGSLQP
jgi:hypothetical protein